MLCERLCDYTKINVHKSLNHSVTEKLNANLKQFYGLTKVSFQEFIEFWHVMMVMFNTHVNLQRLDNKDFLNSQA